MEHMARQFAQEFVPATRDPVVRRATTSGFSSTTLLRFVVAALVAPQGVQGVQSSHSKHIAPVADSAKDYINHGDFLQANFASMLSPAAATAASGRTNAASLENLVAAEGMEDASPIGNATAALRLWAQELSRGAVPAASVEAVLRVARAIAAREKAVGGLAGAGPVQAFPKMHVAVAQNRGRRQLWKRWKDDDGIDGGGLSSTAAGAEDNRGLLGAREGKDSLLRDVGSSDLPLHPALVSGMAFILPVVFMGLSLLSQWSPGKGTTQNTIEEPTKDAVELDSNLDGWPSESSTGHAGIPSACKENTLTVWDGTVATFSSIVGTGVLAMPYAFSVAGVLGGTAAVILFVSCSVYTAHLMAWLLAAKGRNSNIRPEFQGWPFLVEMAFGPGAKLAITVFLIVELWGYLLSAIITCAMNLNQFWEAITMPTAVVATVLVVYGFTMFPARILTRINVISNVGFLLSLLMFLATGLLLPARAPASDIELVQPQGLLSAAGILVFSPAAHSFYPSLMQRMEDPKKYPVCLRRAYIAATLLYLTVAVIGYRLFGSAIQPSAVMNIGVDLKFAPIPGLGWMNTVAAGCLVVKMLAMQPLILTPLTSTVEGLATECRQLVKFVDNGMCGCAVTITVLSLSVAISLRFADEMAVVLNFVGSVFCMTIAFVVPVVCYWKLSGAEIGFWRRLFFVLLVAMGGFFATTAIVAVVI